jgi:hypothetical protein
VVKNKQPRSWDEIAPGHVVIASEGPGNGWWEAIVVEVNYDMLILETDCCLARCCSYQ